MLGLGLGLLLLAGLLGDALFKLFQPLLQQTNLGRVTAQPRRPETHESPTRRRWPVYGVGKSRLFFSLRELAVGVNRRRRLSHGYDSPMNAVPKDSAQLLKKYELCQILAPALAKRRRLVATGGAHARFSPLGC